VAARKNANVAIVAYVTTQARLKLYEYLRELGECVLYCETNSVIYTQKVGKSQKVKTGDYLGDLADELEDFGSASMPKSLCRVAAKTMRFCLFAPK